VSRIALEKGDLDLALQHTAGTAPLAAHATGHVASFAPKRISWGAVLAGVITALAVQLVLSTLGLAIGASTIDPVQNGSPEASSLGIGAGVWYVISALLSVFAGGWVAGRLAGVPIRTDGMLHGFVTWALTTLLLFYLFTTTLGAIVGGAFSAVGSAVGGTARGSAEVAQYPGMANIDEQIRRMLGTTNIEQTSRQLGDAARDENVRNVIRKIVTAGPEGLTRADRESAITALTTHAGMSRTEAEQQLASWERTYAETAAQAREVGEATADAVTQGSMWMFVALIIGAIAGAVGGMLGAPRDVGLAGTAETYSR
jgi:hypothetical protein